MGRPKAGKESIISQEGKIANPFVPATGEENSHSHANNNSTNKKMTNVETTVDLKPNGSPTEKKNSITLARQSVRLKRKAEPVVHFNLVERKTKAPKMQISKSPTPAEISSEKEAPPHRNSTNIETTENTVHLDANGSPPKKITKQSKGIKTNKEPVVRKKKAVKGKQVSTLPNPTEGNSEQEEPPQVHEAVDERHLVKKDNTGPNDSPPTDTDYRNLYLASERRVEELMEDNIDMVRELNFALGKIEAYEKMMGVMDMTLCLSPQRGIPPPTNAAAAPDTTADDGHNKAAASTKRGGKYKKKAKA